MSTAGIEFLREEFAGMAWDKHDPWGCVMEALFDVCEAWWHSTGCKADDYEPSPMLVRTQPEDGSRVDRIYGAFKDGIIDTWDYVYWIDVLNRMRNLVIQAGRDY